MTSSTRAAPPAPIDIGQISLRKAERGLLIGGTEAGKSTLADILRQDFLHRYARVGGRALIVDTKPRYRGEFLINGMSARRRYKRWDHGPVVRGSMVVDEPGQLRSAWKFGTNTVIAQCESRQDLPRVTAIVNAFFADSRSGRPQLVQFDEVLDFYHSNGMARGGDDTADRSARAMRERGTASLYCSQRTYGLSSSLLENMTRGYFMVLDSKRDGKRIQEMGAPDFEWPEDPYEFKYWTKHDRRRIWPAPVGRGYKLALPKGTV